jgi:hypothetical protein
LIVSSNPQKHSSVILASAVSSPQFNREDLREVLFRTYRIVYLLQEDTLFILRVVHGSRDLTALVRREPWEISN